MRVGIDLTALLPEATGVDVSLLGLVRHLARIDPANRYLVFVNHEDRGIFDGSLGANFRVVPLSLRPRAARLVSQQIALPALATALRLDLVHSPSFILPLVRGTPRHLLTIHDMTSFSRPEVHVALRRSSSYRRAVVASVRRADLVTVPSQWVRDDVLARIPEVSPERVRVVPWGVGEAFRPCSSEEARSALVHLALPSSFILFLGTVEPRKNLPALLEAYAALASTGVAEHLVIAGRAGWGQAEVDQRIEALGLRERVHVLGYVASKDLPALYAASRLFVYPSLEEGFGFPPLEAMACGVPTISTSGSAMHENLDGAAELVLPGSVESLAAAMRRLLRDEVRRAELHDRGLERARRFGWPESARAMLACYDELAGRSP